MSKEFGREAKVASATAATLKDLCPEDKAKIGELIKKLAQEKEDKEGLSKEISDVKKNYESIIYNLQSTNNQILKESTDLQDQFRYSLNILKNFQVYITLKMVNSKMKFVNQELTDANLKKTASAVEKKKEQIKKPPINSDKNKIPTTQEKPDSNHLMERSYIPMEGLLITLICFYLYILNLT